MTATDRYVAAVVERVPYPRLREQIAMEVRGHIAERVEHGESEESAMGKLGDPIALAESYLASVPLVSAPFFARAGAKIIDVVLFLTLCLVLCGTVWVLLDRPQVGGVVPLFLFAFIVLIAPGFALYTAIAEHRFSTTIGKHLLGLRVVRESGGRIGFGQALVRQLPMFFEVFMLDVLFALFTDRSQRAFEMASKTRVVKAFGAVSAAAAPLRGAVAI